VSIQQRLKAVEKYVQNEEVFQANYTDGLSDVNLDTLVQSFLLSKKLACFVSVKPRASFHLITIDGEGIVKSIEHITKSGARINGGFFLFRREIFRYINDGEELVEEPFLRLICEGQLFAYGHDSFWAHHRTERSHS
jgi:glucose-1-phosphate cytidylyltransferase